MRREELYLQDISDACKSIISFVAGVTKDKFLETDIIQSTVVQKFTVIGEAASKIGDDIQEERPEIDWKTLVSFRNFLVHAYFHTTMERVWEATIDVAALGEGIDAIIRLLKARQD